MSQETHNVRIENLPLIDNDRLKVQLVPMPGGDNPWRTRADYIEEQRRDTIRFRINIATLIVSAISTASTTAVAIITMIKSMT